MSREADPRGIEERSPRKQASSVRIYGELRDEAAFERASEKASTAFLNLRW